MSDVNCWNEITDLEEISETEQAQDLTKLYTYYFIDYNKEEYMYAYMYYRQKYSNVPNCFPEV
jgi:hypothetical protein